MSIIHFLRYWLPVIICAAAILVLSSITILPDLAIAFYGSDKIFHVFSYVLFSFLMLRAFYSSRPGSSILRLKIRAFTAVFVYGAMIEVYQYFLPARNMEIIDVLSNGIGALIGVLFFKIKTVKIRGRDGEDNTV